MVTGGRTDARPWIDGLGLEIRGVASGGIGPEAPSAGPGASIAYALRSGMTTFDLVDDPGREADLGRLRRATGPNRPRLTLLVPEEPEATTTDELPGGGVRMLPVRARAPEASAPDGRAGWVLDVGRSEIGLDRLREARDRGALGIRVSGGLTSAARLEALTSDAQALGLSTWIRDPYEGGRFDGSFLTTPPGPGGTPGAAEELQAYFAPVLPFGFLAIARRRSLPQAVLRYLLGLPSVEGVLLPDRDAATLASAIRADQTPPLTPEEIRRIRSAGETAPSA